MKKLLLVLLLFCSNKSFGKNRYDKSITSFVNWFLNGDLKNLARASCYYSSEFWLGTDTKNSVGSSMPKEQINLFALDDRIDLFNYNDLDDIYFIDFNYFPL